MLSYKSYLKLEKVLFKVVFQVFTSNYTCACGTLKNDNLKLLAAELEISRIILLIE